MSNPSKPSNQSLTKRQEREILKELLEREAKLESRKVASKPSEGDLAKANQLVERLFKQQVDFFFTSRAEGRFRVAQGTRRMGKTTGAAIKILVTLLRSPRCICLYVAKSTSVVRDQIWPELQQLIAEHDLPFDMHDTQLRIRHKRSTGRAIFRGASDAANIEKMRGLGVGGPFLLAILDESGSFGEHLENAVRSVISPGLRDYGGELLLIGTPPYFPAGLFYEAYTGTRDIFKHWVRRFWTLQDNVKLSKEARDYKLIMLEEGLTWDDPIMVREWRGIQCINTNTQMFEYDPARNGFIPNDGEGGREPLPPCGLTYWLGVDFGWTDETAIVALGWNPTTRKMWAVESWAAPGQTADDTAAKLVEFQRKYRPARIVGDTGGYGKGVAMPIWQDYGIFIEQAQKMEKLNHIEFMNSAFRRSDLMVNANDALSRELPLVLWAEGRKDAHNRAKDNRSMALLYVWRVANDIAGKTALTKSAYTQELADGWPEEELRAKLQLSQSSRDDDADWYLGEI